VTDAREHAVAAELWAPNGIAYGLAEGGADDDAPLRGDPSTILETIQRRVERPLITRSVSRDIS
jgi:hypothetical protein